MGNGMKWFFVITALAFLLSGCDFIYPPFMRNGLDRPIRVRTIYTNGEITDDEWAPRMEVACGRKDAKIKLLTVTLQGKPIQQLDLNDIGRMENSVKDMRKVIWEVRRNQIVRLPR